MNSLNLRETWKPKWVFKNKFPAHIQNMKWQQSQESEYQMITMHIDRPTKRSTICWYYEHALELAIFQIL
jgi:hypothetical protein